MQYTPVVLFVYNRADHFRKTFEALSACPEASDTELYIFADGAKDEAGVERVNACRAAVREASNNCVFKKVHITEAPQNRGLAASVISGVSSVIEKYGSVIVLEDDSVVSPYFLRFMNVSLEKFENDKRVGAIAGYTPSIPIPDTYRADIFTCYRSCSCGWATWADRWRDVDWELKDIGDFYRDPTLIKRMNADGTDRFLRLYRQIGGGSSWSVRFGAHLVKKNMLTVYPRYSLIKNIGADDTGVHSTAQDAATMEVDLDRAIPDPIIGFAAPDKRISRLMRRHYSGGIVSDMKRFAGTALIVCKERLK